MYMQKKAAVVMRQGVWLWETSLRWVGNWWITKLNPLKLSCCFGGFLFFFFIFLLKQVTYLHFTGYLEHCHKALPTLVFLLGPTWLYDADRRLHYSSSQSAECRHAGGEYGNALCPARGSPLANKLGMSPLLTGAGLLVQGEMGLLGSRYHGSWCVKLGDKVIY